MGLDTGVWLCRPWALAAASPPSMFVLFCSAPTCPSAIYRSKHAGPCLRPARGVGGDMSKGLPPPAAFPPRAQVGAQTAHAVRSNSRVLGMVYSVELARRRGCAEWVERPRVCSMGGDGEMRSLGGNRPQTTDHRLQTAQQAQASPRLRLPPSLVSPGCACLCLSVPVCACLCLSVPVCACLCSPPTSDCWVWDRRSRVLKPPAANCTRPPAKHFSAGRPSSIGVIQLPFPRDTLSRARRGFKSAAPALFPSFSPSTTRRPALPCSLHARSRSYSVLRT